MADEEYEIDVYGDTNVGEVEINVGRGEANGQISSNASHVAEGLGVEDIVQTQARDSRQQPDATRPAQGLKRKSESDDRPVDPGATVTLLVSDLNWWNTDDDIRGWAEQARCGHELKDVTFSEYKVNGKSKGQAYVEFVSQQAATATKRVIDAVESDQPGGQKKHSVIYTNPAHNPFKASPKDGPIKHKEPPPVGRPMVPSYNNDRPNIVQSSGYVGNFRGGRGGGPNGGFGVSRGANMANHAGFNRNNFNSHNNFNPMGAGMNQIGGGFNNNNNNNNNGQNNFGFNRGNALGIRAGGHMRRGGLPHMNMMTGMPMGLNMGMMNQGMVHQAMGNSAMGNAAMVNPAMGNPAMGNPAMGNPAMGNHAMGMGGFQMQGQFNPFFQPGANEWQNPHGNKRSRSD